MSTLRRRLRSFNSLNSPVDVKFEPAAGQESSSDSTCDPSQSSKPRLVHGGEVSLPSNSDYATGEELDELVTTFASQGETSASGARSTPSEPQTPQNEEHNMEPVEKAWYDVDFSVVLALAPSIGNWLTGGDHVKHLLLIVLLVFYLHQIIEIPWGLYLLSRPRHKPLPTVDESASIEDRYHRKAVSELRFLEFFCLSLAILSPFLGALLLRTTITSVSGPSALSWFNTSLFVLATGIRPWKHAVERLRERATDLQDVIHYPSSEIQRTQSRVEALLEKLLQLEAELKEVKDQLEAFTTEIHEHVEDAIDVAERTARRQDRRSEAARTTHETRLMRLEQSVECLLERNEIRADGSGATPAFFSAIMDNVFLVLPGWTTAKLQEKLISSPRLSPKLGRSRSAPKLETIPEVAAFQTSRSGFSFSRIPGFDLALRIGNLTTLPVRRIVTYLLAGRL